MLSRLVWCSNCIWLHALRMCCCCCCTIAASPCACCVSFCCCSALRPKWHQVRFLVNLRVHGVGGSDELGVSLARVLKSPVGSEASSACICCCCFVLRSRMEAERRSGTLGCGMRVGAGGEAKCVVVGVMLLLCVPFSGVSVAVVVGVVVGVHSSCCCSSSSPCTDDDDVSSGNNDVIACVAVAVAVVILLLLLFLAESKMQIIAIVCCCLFVFCTFENKAIFSYFFELNARLKCFIILNARRVQNN